MRETIAYYRKGVVFTLTTVALAIQLAITDDKFTQTEVLTVIIAALGTVVAVRVPNGERPGA